MQDRLVVSLVLLAIIAVTAFIFRKQIGRRLALRVAFLVFSTVMVVAMTTVLLSETLFNNAPTPGGPFFGLLLFTLIPLFIGFVTSRLVNRPLKRFTLAIKSLEVDKTHGEIQLSGIREFDQVTSEFNELMTRLRNEEELRKNLISDTSHELNTPLTAMIGQLSAMRDGALPINKARINTLYEQTERLLDLVKQLDMYAKARVVDGRTFELIRLRHISQKAVREMSESLKEKNIKATIKIDSELKVPADPIALNQILLNLIQNTYRYSGAKNITIVASKTSLTFYDDGVGVPNESLPYLFERFYRVDPSRNRNTGGLGLGLAIVAELVQRHGWRVHAENANPGLAVIIHFES